MIFAIRRAKPFIWLGRAYHKMAAINSADVNKIMKQHDVPQNNMVLLTHE